jgi:hypothetical protein
VLVLLSVAVGGCGGGQRQDAKEPAKTYRLTIVDASFPLSQHVAGTAHMRVRVRNDGTSTAPVVAVTVRGFDYRENRSDLADATRPGWIVDAGPRGGDSAYVGTWALGPLRPGASRTFEWTVTPVVAGTHDVSYEVAAGLAGKAKVALEGRRPPGGKFTVRVSGKPADSTVDPSTGQVVRR